MKAIHDKLLSLGISYFPEGPDNSGQEVYSVYKNHKYQSLYTWRALVQWANSFRKPVTKVRHTCKTPRPGCSYCDDKKEIVKTLDKKAKRRQGKKEVRREAAESEEHTKGYVNKEIEKYDPQSEYFNEEEFENKILNKMGLGDSMENYAGQLSE